MATLNTAVQNYLSVLSKLDYGVTFQPETTKSQTRHIQLRMYICICMCVYMKYTLHIKTHIG